MPNLPGTKTFLKNRSGTTPCFCLRGGNGKYILRAEGAYYRMIGDPTVDTWVRWGQTQRDPITDGAIGREFGEVARRAKQFSTALDGELTMCLDGGPLQRIARNWCAQSRLPGNGGTDVGRGPLGNRLDRRLRSRDAQHGDVEGLLRTSTGADATREP